MNTKLKRHKKKKLSKIFNSLQAYSASKYSIYRKKSRYNIIKAYKLRFSQLAHKFFALINSQKILPRKFFFFSVWRKSIQEKLKIRAKFVGSHQKLVKLKKGIKGLKLRVLNKNVKNKTIERVHKYYKRKIIGKCFRAAVKFVDFNKICKGFVIRRVRNEMKRALRIWGERKLQKSRVGYLDYKCSVFRTGKLSEKAWDSLVLFMRQEKVLRKLNFFWGLWVKIHKKQVKYIQDFTITCRKRHLMNFYFKQLQKSVIFAKQEKKSDFFYKKLLFSKFKYSVYHQKSLRKKFSAIFKILYEKKTLKKVNFI